MTARAADALVFFGATGDLAYRKIFPALQELARRGRLAVPVIGVARDGTLDDLRTRARETVESQVGVDQSAFERLMGLLHYVSGDYTDPGTFDRLRRELGNAARPIHYLAIPPALFAPVLDQLGRSGCARGAGRCSSTIPGAGARPKRGGSRRRGDGLIRAADDCLGGLSSRAQRGTYSSTAIPTRTTPPRMTRANHPRRPRSVRTNAGPRSTPT